jgi:protein-tyrosine phosphatase
MTDIHCHVLPYVDYDGPQEMEESLRMLRRASALGIDRIIATPHITSEEGRDRLDEFGEVFEELKENARKEEVDVELSLGAEIYVTPDLCDFVKKGGLFLDAVGHYVLVELPTYDFPPYAQPQFLSLLSDNVIPVLAHPERNSRIIKNPELLFSLSRAGVLFQLSAGSLVGSFGRDAQGTAETLLASGLCHFVASDAHSDGIRGFRLKEAKQAVRRLLGEPSTEEIFEDNPARIVGPQPT